MVGLNEDVVTQSSLCLSCMPSSFLATTKQIGRAWLGEQHSVERWVDAKAVQVARHVGLVWCFVSRSVALDHETVLSLVVGEWDNKEGIVGLWVVDVNVQLSVCKRYEGDGE